MEYNREVWLRKERRIMELTEYCERHKIYDAQTIKLLAMRFYNVSPMTAESYAEIVQSRLILKNLKAPIVI